MNKFTGSQPTMNSFSWKKDFFERYSNQCVCTLQCVCTGAAYQMSQEKGDISLVSKNLCIPHIFLWLKMAYKQWMKLTNWRANKKARSCSPIQVYSCNLKIWTDVARTDKEKLIVLVCDSQMSLESKVYSIRNKKDFWKIQQFFSVKNLLYDIDMIDCSYVFTLIVFLPTYLIVFSLQKGQVLFFLQVYSFWWFEQMSMEKNCQSSYLTHR